MMEDVERRVKAVATEIRDLAPGIAELVIRARTASNGARAASLAPRQRAEYQLPCEIGSAALERCEILVVNNVIMPETLGIIALTRYVFELLVWLRTIQRTPIKSLYFLMTSMADSEAHTSQHLAQLEAEAAFLDDLGEYDVPNTEALLAEHGASLTAEIVQAAEKLRMDEIDLEARRHFSAYAADAKVHGYKYQAHLIRKRAIPVAKSDLEARQKVRSDFVDQYGQTLIAEAGSAMKWSWFEAAKTIGMAAEYEYIYRYTSRLLHATPSSFYTTAKNLDPTEMRLFLEYVYVRLLDVIDVVSEFTERAESAADQAPGLS